MKNVRMGLTAAVAAGVVVLGGCGGSGTVGATQSSGGTGPVGAASSGGGGSTDRTGGTVAVSGSTGAPGTPTGSPAGSSSGGASSSPTAAAAGTGDPCGLVNAADVARLAKLPPPSSGGAPTTKPSQDSGGNKYCLVDDGEAESAQVGIGPITREEFDLQKMDPNTQTVGGVGEAALYSPSDGMLKVYKGGKQLSVWVIHGGFGGDDPATLTQEKAIAQIAVGRM